MQSVTVLWTVLGVYVMIYIINLVLMCMRPKMAMDSGSQSGTDDWIIGREQ